jgi:bla regulator protein BlaR1
MIDILIRASFEGAVIVCAIWLTLRVLPQLSPGAKAMLWWCAAAKVVISLTWGTPVTLPILPPVAANMAAAFAPSEPVTATRNAETMAAAAATAVGERRPSIPWTTIVLGLWAAGCAMSLVLALRRWRETRHMIARSHDVPARVEELATALCALLSLRKPQIRLSHEVDSPLVTGLIRPVVLLPETRFPHLTGELQRMALCHELVHLKRFDMWLGCIPAAAERLFFFHPLVRLAAREFAFWREAACDAAVLQALDAPAQSYGRLLLGLGVSSQRRSLSAAGAAWSFANMKRRIVMLHSARESSIGMRIVSGAVVGLALLATAPLTLGARPSSSVQVAAGPDIVAESRSSKDGLRFVFFASAEQTTMSGRSEDVEKARRLRTGGEPLLWFSKDGREYIVRDPSILAELQGLWGSVTVVGAEQSIVGSKQATIGARQAEIGSRQASVGAEQAVIGARQASIGARQAAVSVQELKAVTEAERAAAQRNRRAVEEEMRALDVEMQKLTEKMRSVDAPMRDLDDDMRVLDEEMRVLETKMREAEKKAEAAMRALIDRAIASGAAQQVR